MPILGYTIPAFTTIDPSIYTFLLPMTGARAVTWGDWLRIRVSFVITYMQNGWGIGVCDERLNVHSGDIAGAASITFPYLGSDQKVGILDVNPIAFNWGLTVSWTGTIDPTDTLHRADIDGSGRIGITDVNLIAFNWGKTWTNTPPS
jgi:hypothetical protein